MPWVISRAAWPGVIEWTYADPGGFSHVSLNDFFTIANTKAEGAVISLHRNLAKYIGTGSPVPLG